MYLVKNLGNKAVHENSEIKQSTVNILDLLRKSLLQVHPVYQCGN